jgi:hypothetical protein
LTSNRILKAPSGVVSDPRAVEILRVWICRATFHVTINNLKEDPADWGAVLAGMARIFANGIKWGGVSPPSILQRIREGVDYDGWEIADSASHPDGLTLAEPGSGKPAWPELPAGGEDGVKTVGGYFDLLDNLCREPTLRPGGELDSKRLETIEGTLAVLHHGLPLVEDRLRDLTYAPALGQLIDDALTNYRSGDLENGALLLHELRRFIVTHCERLR